MKLAATALLFTALLASSAASQLRYGAVLDGAQETPALTPGSGGWARITVNPDNSITYDVRAFGLSGTLAHIHKGAVGVPGPIIFALSGGPTVWSGTTVPMTVGQEADLSSGLYYVNVHTIANPGGEIRGQLLASPRVFGARLDNTQETTPNASTAKGTALITLNANNSLTYTVTTTGLVGGTIAHFHAGTFGVAGGIEVSLTGGPTTWSGTSLPISDGQIGALQTLGWYANVHSAANPGGEIRGQIVPSGEDLFNSASAEWAPMLTMTSSGAPTDVADNGTFTLAITGGKPGGSGLLLVSFLPGCSLFNLQPFMIDVGSILVSGLALPLNGAGALTIPVLTPNLPVTVNITLQFFGLDNTSVNGKFNSSSAVAMTLQHF